jgi:hypothetical protein
MVSMSDELKEHNILKLILIVRFACATLDVGHPIHVKSNSSEVNASDAPNDSDSISGYLRRRLHQLAPTQWQIQYTLFLQRNTAAAFGGIVSREKTTPHRG